MVEYQIKEERLYRTDVGEYTSYGITASQVQKGERVELLYISDVFLSLQKAQKLVRMCNQHNLDSVHLMAVVEDFVGAD